MPAEVGIVLALAATWPTFVLVFLIFRPKDISLSEAKRLVPDIIRLLRALGSDTTPRSGVRRRPGLCWPYLHRRPTLQ